MKSFHYYERTAGELAAMNLSSLAERCYTTTDPLNIFEYDYENENGETKKRYAYNEDHNYICYHDNCDLTFDELNKRLEESQKSYLRIMHEEETNDPETMEWREDLIPEELEYVKQLDEEYEKIFSKMAADIVNLQEETTSAAEQYYKYFYSYEYKEADAFAAEKGWNKLWASESEGMNGDTWIIYRDIEDLPKHLQKHAEIAKIAEKNLQQEKLSPARLAYQEYRKQVDAIYKYEVDNNIPENERMTRDLGFGVTDAKSGYDENSIAVRYDEITMTDERKQYEKNLIERVREINLHGYSFLVSAGDPPAVIAEPEEAKKFFTQQEISDIKDIITKQRASHVRRIDGEISALKELFSDMNYCMSNSKTDENLLRIGELLTEKNQLTGQTEDLKLLYIDDGEWYRRVAGFIGDKTEATDINGHILRVGDTIKSEISGMRVVMNDLPEQSHIDNMQAVKVKDFTELDLKDVYTPAFTVSVRSCIDEYNKSLALSQRKNRNNELTL